MGYEIKLIIGKTSSISNKEHVEDMTKPFSDGSGFEWKKDADGNPVFTGRTETFFDCMAEVDLCKVGEGKVSSLVGEVQKMAEKNADKCFYFYGTTDGNKSAKEDRYGDKLHPVPISDVLSALEADAELDDYRRFRWAIALLKSMKDDSEGLEVMFWGH
jgi:hypothetical protein